MQKTAFLLCLVLYITLTSSDCNKKTSPEPPSNDTYQPTTAGSEWNYTTTGTTTSGPVNTAFKLMATANDSSANGRTYRIFTNTVGANEYYNKSGNDYYRISTFAGFPTPLEFLYLKDNLSAGATWSETKNITISGFPVTANVTYSIVGSKYDTSFNGNSFKDVIRIKVTPAIPGVTIENNEVYYLFAKNTGMIANKVRLKISLASIDINTETKLGAYTVK